MNVVNRIGGWLRRQVFPPEEPPLFGRKIEAFHIAGMKMRPDFAGQLHWIIAISPLLHQRPCCPVRYRIVQKLACCLWSEVRFVAVVEFMPHGRLNLG